MVPLVEKTYFASNSSQSEYCFACCIPLSVSSPSFFASRIAIGKGLRAPGISTHNNKSPFPGLSLLLPSDRLAQPERAFPNGHKGHGSPCPGERDRSIHIEFPLHSFS